MLTAPLLLHRLLVLLALTEEEATSWRRHNKGDNAVGRACCRPPLAAICLMTSRAAVDGTEYVPFILFLLLRYQLLVLMSVLQSFFFLGRLL